MNCQECRSLVERFLDHALTGFTKRKVNLHLSRCTECRAYFDRRKQNQALAYRALNTALAGMHLPEGFADRFRAAHIVPDRHFRLFGLGRPWKVAATLAVVVTFIGFAAVVVTDRMWPDSANTKSAVDMVSHMSDVDESDVRSSTEDDSPVVSYAPMSLESSSSEILPINKGEQNMTIRKSTTVALAATLVATAPLGAANGDEYQFIDPTTYPAANYSHKASSSAVTLNAGAIPIASVAADLEACSRSNGRSSAITLNATQFKGFYMSFK